MSRGSCRRCPRLKVFAFPGYVLTVALGVSPHGGGLGGWRDYILVPIGSGLFLGTLVYVILRLLQLVLRVPFGVNGQAR
jgi:hypothetical protein